MRKYIVILLLVAALIVCNTSATLSTYEPNLSLLMHMNSSPANPTFFNDSSTNNFKFTSSGNVGHNLSESAFGNATANFTAAGAGYLTTPRTAALGLNGVKNYTVMLWFKRYGTADGVLMGAFGGAGGPEGFGIRMNYPGNGLFQIYTPTARSTTSAFTNATGFHQLVVHINNSVVQVYIDGVAQTMDSASAVTPSSTDTGNYHFGTQGGTYTYYTGAIDEIAIWKNVTIPIADLYPQTAELYLTSLAPVASFTASNTTGIYPPALPVKFTDTSTNTPTSWQWNFTNTTGNNTAVTFSTTQSPLWSFDIGNFSISLKATNADGSDLSDQVTWINVSAPTTVPVANFTANGAYTSISGTVPFTVNFVYPQTNGSTSWSWIFGDGNTTGNSDQNPSHLYTVVGTYSVNHSATNVIGIGWKNVSSMIVVTNASGFTPQDIWMQGQYLQTFHITDSSTGLPIPVVDLQDTAMQTYTTTNGTGYLTEAFGSSSVTFVSSGYDSRAISYFFDSDATWDVQLTETSPTVIPNTNTLWSPTSVAIQILDANYVPILGDPVYITAYSSSLPGGLSGAVEYFKSAYGVSDSVAQSMFAANTTYYGTTDDNGFISAQVVSIIQYQIVTHDTNGNNVTRLMWPAGAYYQIVTENATVAGIAAQGRAQTSIYKNSTFNTTFWEPNTTYSCMGINVYDSTGATTNVSAWWKLVDNGTVWWTNSTSIGGYGPINSSRCVPHVPYQQWKWGGITD